MVVFCLFMLCIYWANSCLAGGESSVGEPDGACDEGGAVTYEEGDDVCDFVGLCDSAEWVEGFHFFFGFVSSFLGKLHLGEGCVDVGGADAVDADGGCEFEGEGFGHGGDGAFGCAVGGAEVVAGDACVAGDVDDRAARGSQTIYDGFGYEVGAFEVGVDDVCPVLFGGAVYAFFEVDAGGVDECVEFAVVSSDDFAEACAVGCAAYVAGDEGGVFAEGFFCFLSFFFVSACDDDVVAVLYEEACGRKADAAGASCDECCFHGWSPSFRCHSVPVRLGCNSV